MATPMRFLTPTRVAAVAVPVVLPGCGSDTTTSTGGRYDTTTATIATTLTANAGTVTIAMRHTSTSGMPHAIGVKGNGVDEEGPIVQPGGISRVTVTLKPGTYSYYCPVPGHEPGGMKGTPTVMP